MIQGIVLLVDNKPMYADTRAEILRRSGCVVHCAYSPDEARGILRTRWVHLVILDNRLIDDDDPEDRSGLELAKEPEFSHIAKMILTGFATVDIVRDALTPGQRDNANILRFRSKKEPIEDILKDIEEIFETHIQINRELKVHWKSPTLTSPSSLVMQLDPALPSADLAEGAAEIDDLLRMVFHDYDQITISRLLWAHPERLALDVSVFSGHHVTQYILQLKRAGTKGSPQTAAMEPPVAEGLVARIQKRSRSVHYEALAWKLERSLSECTAMTHFVRENGERRIITALESLYLTALSPWYQTTLEVSDGDLAQQFQVCTEIPTNADTVSTLDQKIHFLLKLSVTAKLIVNYHIDGETIHLQGYDLERPIHLVHPRQRLMAPSVGHRLLRQISSPGNIHLDTLLVDRTPTVVLTDYSLSKPAPCEVNFISLELDARVFECGTDELITILELERELSGLSDLTTALPSTNVDSQCRKSMSMILAIRRLAHQVFQSEMGDYSTGLFFMALQRLMTINESLRYLPDELTRYLHYLLIVGLMNHANSGTAVWTNAGDSQTGIQIDEKNHSVAVNGRPVSLTPTEYDLLLFLYKHQGSLCRREDILMEVFHFSDPDPNAEKSLLNTHMGRLRAKVEVDPGNPRFILTVRSQGYKLDPHPEGTG
jgi:DNA-binding response OmpR family regulator